MSVTFLSVFPSKFRIQFALSPYVPHALSIIRVIHLYEFLVVNPVRHMPALLFLQDCPTGGTAKPSQIHAVAPVAMVETVAEGEAHVERHAHRG